LRLHGGARVDVKVLSGWHLLYYSSQQVHRVLKRIELSDSLKLTDQTYDYIAKFVSITGFCLWTPQTHLNFSE